MTLGGVLALTELGLARIASQATCGSPDLVQFRCALCSEYLEAAVDYDRAAPFATAIDEIQAHLLTHFPDLEAEIAESVGTVQLWFSGIQWL